jgi:hypothetical protein
VCTAEAHAREERSNRGGFGNSLPVNSMASRVSFQGSTTSSAQRGAAEATDSDAATLLARRARRRSSKAKAEVRAELDWRVRGCERSVLPVADSARFRRRMRVQGNGPRACRLGAVDTGASRSGALEM